MGSTACLAALRTRSLLQRLEALLTILKKTRNKATLTNALELRGVQGLLGALGDLAIRAELLHSLRAFPVFYIYDVATSLALSVMIRTAYLFAMIRKGRDHWRTNPIECE